MNREDLAAIEKLQEKFERRELGSYSPYIKAVTDNASDLIERARRAEELEREVEQLRERERQQRKQLNHIEAYCEDYARDITTSHKMMREVCEVVGVEQGPDR